MIAFTKNWIGAFADWRKLLSLAFLPRYLRDFVAFRSQAKRTGNWPVRVSDTFPCLSDRLPTTPFDPHYLYQGAWIARRLADQKPVRHYDIGSSVLTVSVLSAHVPTVFVDYRPLMARQPGLVSVAADITRLPFADKSLDSLSCLHVIEHIGLGRYGDPLDPEGAHKGIKELQRVLKPGGRLYLSTPVGHERVCFNAHRVFAPATIVEWLHDLELAEFSYVSDQGLLHAGAALKDAAGQDYGCGLFEFVCKEIAS